MPKRLTINKIKNKIQEISIGYSLLSNIYKNNHSKLDFQCPEKHIFKMSWAAFQRGQRCTICAGNHILSIKEIKKKIQKISIGYNLISNVYENNRSKLDFQCPNGHIFKMSWGNFSQGHRCPECIRPGFIKQNIAFYDTYAHQISFAEIIRRSKKDQKILEVKCKKCDKWFVPTRSAVHSRIQSLNNNGLGECNLYCSNKCKNSCSIYNTKLYQHNHPNKQTNDRPYQLEWAKVVKENAGFECERCGSKDNLIAHHIKPIKTHPNLQADVDNGICVCEKCDKEYFHQLDGCKTGQLARMVC